MQVNPNVGSMDAVLDKLYGKVGSPEREEFRKEAYSYCVGQLIYDARKQERMTQAQLAENPIYPELRKGLLSRELDFSFVSLMRLV